MPKIAQYEPNQVRTQITKQPLAKDAPRDAFGGPIAKGLADVGKGLGSIAQASFDLKKRLDTTSAEEALVQFERDKNNLFFNPESGYFNTQGRNAYDGSIAATKAMDDLKIKYGDTLGVDAKLLFDKAANAHITRGSTDIMRHAAKGMQTWEIATIEAQVENSIENASLYWGDSKLMKSYRINGEQSVLDASKLAGIGAEATNEKLQTYRSSFAKAAINAATVNSSASGAVALEEYGDMLEGPDKVKIESMIEKKHKTEKTKADAQVAVMTAINLSSKYDNLADITAEVDEKYKDDPELHKKVMSEARARFNILKQAKTGKQKENYDNVIDLVNQNKTIAEIQSLAPKAWEGMSALQENNIRSGKHLVSDQVLLNEINSMSDKEISEIDPNSLAGKLNPNDVDKIVRKQSKINNGVNNSRVRTLAVKSKEAVKLAFPGKWKSTKTGKLTETGKRASQLLDDIQSQVSEFENDNKRKITPDEEKELLLNITSPIIQKRYGNIAGYDVDMFAEDWELNLENTSSEDLLMLNRIVSDNKNIDKGQLIKAYQSLIDEGEEINFKNIGAKYSQGK